jgi:hypothetical protein
LDRAIDGYGAVVGLVGSPDSATYTFYAAGG